MVSKRNKMINWWANIIQLCALTHQDVGRHGGSHFLCFLWLFECFLLCYLSYSLFFSDRYVTSCFSLFHFLTNLSSDLSSCAQQIQLPHPVINYMCPFCYHFPYNFAVVRIFITCYHIELDFCFIQP